MLRIYKVQFSFSLPSGQIIQPLLFPYEKSYFNEKTKKKERVSSLLQEADNELHKLKAKYKGR